MIVKDKKIYYKGDVIFVDRNLTIFQHEDINESVYYTELPILVDRLVFGLHLNPSLEQQSFCKDHEDIPVDIIRLSEKHCDYICDALFTYSKKLLLEIGANYNGDIRIILCINLENLDCVEDGKHYESQYEYQEIKNKISLLEDDLQRTVADSQPTFFVTSIACTIQTSFFPTNWVFLTLTRFKSSYPLKFYLIKI